MYIFEPSNRIEVSTPKGDGIILFITDYGHETDTVYTIVINETKEFWQYTNKDIRAKSNLTFNRK